MLNLTLRPNFMWELFRAFQVSIRRVKTLDEPKKTQMGDAIVLSGVQGLDRGKTYPSL